MSFLTHKCAMELRLPDFQCGVLPIPRAAAATYGLPDGELQETLRVILRTISAQKQWQAKCMGVDVPVLPVHTHAEKVLYFKVQRRMRQRLKWPPSYLETTREYNKCGSDYRLVLAGGVERSGRSNPVQTLKPDCYFKTAAHIAAYEAFCDRSENMRSTLHLFQPNEKLRAIASSNTAYSNFEADASSTATSRRPLPSHSAAAARSAAPSAAPSAAITSPPGSTRSAAARRGAVGVSASNERPAPSADRSAPAPSPPSPPAPSPSASLPWQQAAVLVPPAGLPSFLSTSKGGVLAPCPCCQQLCPALGLGCAGHCLQPLMVVLIRLLSQRGADAAGSATYLGAKGRTNCGGAPDGLTVTRET